MSKRRCTSAISFGRLFTNSLLLLTAKITSPCVFLFLNYVLCFSAQSTCRCALYYTFQQFFNFTTGTRAVYCSSGC